MAKVAKPKKREPTIHSRAHRRNASPPPKDLAVEAAPAAEESEYKPWLHNAQNAGVSKKRKVKLMSRQQKERQQKAMEKADANLDKLATKVKDSKARGRKVQARRADWEELNGGGSAVVDGAKVGGGGEQMEESEDEEEGERQGEANGKSELDVGMAGDEANTTRGEEHDEKGNDEAAKEPEEDEEL